jgi:hypothetical protein
MLRLEFFVPNDIMKYPSLVTPSCPLSGPTFWKHGGSILSLVESFFSGSFTWVGVYVTFSKCSFRYHASTCLFMCGSKGRCLVINSSYHTYILYHNFNLGLATKERACEGVGQKWSPGITFHVPRNVKECEGMNPTFTNELSLWELESQSTPKSLKGNCRGQNLFD